MCSCYEMLGLYRDLESQNYLTTFHIIYIIYIYSISLLPGYNNIIRMNKPFILIWYTRYTRLTKTIIYNIFITQYVRDSTEKCQEIPCCKKRNRNIINMDLIYIYIHAIYYVNHMTVIMAASSESRPIPPDGYSI